MPSIVQVKQAHLVMLLRIYTLCAHIPNTHLQVVHHLVHAHNVETFT